MRPVHVGKDGREEFIVFHFFIKEVYEFRDVLAVVEVGLAHRLCFANLARQVLHREFTFSFLITGRYSLFFSSFHGRVFRIWWGVHQALRAMLTPSRIK